MVTNLELRLDKAKSCVGLLVEEKLPCYVAVFALSLRTFSVRKCPEPRSISAD